MICPALIFKSAPVSATKAGEAATTKVFPHSRAAVYQGPDLVRYNKLNGLVLDYF